MARGLADFDFYTRDPSPSLQAWMREHYERMEVYSPYFDSRLSWYPNGWVYKDLYAIKDDWPVFREHPEWILRDASGNKLYIPFDCSGGTCPQFAGDFGDPNFRRWWLNELHDTMEAEYRGITIDDVNFTWRVSNGNGDHVTPIDDRTGRPMTLDDWRRYMADFLEDIRAEFPNVEMVHNMVWFAAEPDDPHLLRAIDNADVIHLERGVSDKGLVGGDRSDSRWGLQTYLRFIDAVHARGADVAIRDRGTNARLREYGLAGWLLTSSGRDIYGVDIIDWILRDSYWTGFDADLGTALESWVRQSNGLLRRRFTCGVVYFNQVDQPTTTQSLGETMTRVDGSRMSSVTLVEQSAGIFKSDSCDAPPEPDTTIRQDIRGETVAAPLLLTGTSTAGAGVDYIWLAIRDLDNERYWTGDQWLNEYTRFKVDPKTRGAQSTDWSYQFQPPAPGTFQAFARTVDLDGGWDPDSDQVWFRIGEVNVSQEPETTIRQDIRGQTLSAPVNLSGTASAAKLVDYVWIAIHDIDRDQWWTGSGWQNGYTRFIVQPVTPNAAQTDWRYNFSPGRSGAYQAHARAIDKNDGFDPSAAEVWFHVR